MQLSPRRVPCRARREENLKVDKCVSGGQTLTKLALVFFILILIFLKKFVTLFVFRHLLDSFA